MTETEPALLIVDDNEDNRYTLTRRLRRQGYTNLFEAENGEQALEMLKHQRFDLVLLDVMMPVMNGYETLERMKVDPDSREIPVIMISAVDDMDSVVKCIELGAEDYLPKPFNAVLLKARVAACLDKKRMRDQELVYRAELEQERNRADGLLHAILPRAAVDELKATNSVAPRRFDGVAVLFCDIVGFTEFCNRHPPEAVIGHLQDWVTVSEEIVHAHGLEKIKTIGDAFMATADLLQPVDNAALTSVRCGLEMAAAVRDLEAGWQVRVGVHCGPVVAGVIGNRQFLFDLWGDTVNIAARVAGKADPGAVVVSTEIWREIAVLCDGRSIGMTDLKGKGSVELFECNDAS